MELAQIIHAIFPAKEDIPAEFLLASPLRQDVYLVNGELRRWDGPMQDVVSPVHIKTAEAVKELDRLSSRCQMLCGSFRSGPWSPPKPER